MKFILIVVSLLWVIPVEADFFEIRNGLKYNCTLADPQQACKDISGDVYCGYDCQYLAGNVYCGSKPGFKCSYLLGNIYCGIACAILSGAVYCAEGGIASPATPREPVSP